MSDINFVNVDAEDITSQLINDFESYMGETLYPGDPRRQFLQGFGYVIVGLLNNINTTGRSNLLRYAYDDLLEELGAFSGTSRLQASTASSMIKFTLSTAQPTSITIPAGARVTPDGYLFFALEADVIIASGITEVTAQVWATGTGTEYNGFAVGQINKLVDGNPYVASVTNTTVSAGGADVESDDDYRERVRISPFGLSTAGPSQAYEFLARSASADVGDISVYSPSAGSVYIAVVKKGGIIPLAADPVILAISATCSSKTRRPLTDNLSVIPAVAISVAISANYYISQTNLTKATEIQAAVTLAVSEYKAWQVERMGRDINPDELKKRMLNAGAAKVDLTSPVYTTVSNNKVAQFTTTTITYMGTIND